MNREIYKRSDFKKKLPVEIPFGNRSQIWLSFGFAGPTFFGLWLFFFISPQCESLLLFWATRLLAFSMVFPAVFYLARSLQAGIQRKPGLIIDENGFEDRSGPASLGRVFWEDVTDVRKNRSGDSILVDLAEPEVYIQNQFSPLKPAHIKRNLAESRAPIRIQARNLAYPLNDTLEIMIEAYCAFQKNQS